MISLMGIKSITKSFEVQEAKKAHKCSSNSRHIINQGDRRLSIKEGRSAKTYCIQCANKILNNGILNLSEVLNEIK